MSQFPRKQKNRAGRPKGIPWQAVERLAALGGQGDEIRAALAIPEEALRDPAALLKFRGVIETAHLALRASVREQLFRIAAKGTRGKSVTAALALARNILSWDRPHVKPGTKPPDDEAAIAELERVLSAIETGSRYWPKCKECGQPVLPGSDLTAPKKMRS